MPSSKIRDYSPKRPYAEKRQLAIDLAKAEAYAGKVGFRLALGRQVERRPAGVPAPAPPR